MYRYVKYHVNLTRLHIQAVAFGSAVDQMMVAKEYKKFKPDVSGFDLRLTSLVQEFITATV